MARPTKRNCDYFPHFVSQNKELFSKNLNLSAEMAIDFKELYKNTNDSTFIKTQMIYKSSNGEHDTITIKVRVRGNFRKRYCYT